MFTGKSKPQPNNAVPIGKDLVALTEREAIQTVGGCGRLESPELGSSAIPVPRSYEQG